MIECYQDQLIYSKAIARARSYAGRSHIVRIWYSRILKSNRSTNPELLGSLDAERGGGDDGENRTRVGRKKGGWDIGLSFVMRKFSESEESE